MLNSAILKTGISQLQQVQTLKAVCIILLVLTPERKYPVIVYYYGGIRPVGRTFGGRYPFNLWAGNDYLVYVLQPSGAVGFGQEFSAAHVNNWGTHSCR
jgi:dipeptidyl aminopeptidase/acylaminoacyl peptidase